MAKQNDKAPRSDGGGIPGPIWMLGGFALGVIVTVLYRVGTPVVTPDPGVAADRGASRSAGPASAPSTEFTFDEILGGVEVVVPGKLKPETPTTDPRSGVAKPAPAYALQVGAFRTEAEADRLRAELALLGFEARIQKATIDDKDTWFRVRLGPFKDGAEFEKVRARLAENRIKSVPVRGG